MPAMGPGIAFMDAQQIEGTEDQVFADDVSDEALEAAAVAMRVTLAACTAVWSTFCNA